ncbi:MAG: peptide-methionine (S)-S-oxide reductase MsrA [Candidatus Micrarchaeota archaeon]
MEKEKATFGAGCFWHVEAAFMKARGVLSTSVGFMGGRKKNPTYKQVCNGDTGHTEVVNLEFDPSVVGYKELLELFWKIHDPTTLNRQGPDVGEQYRSVIFYHNEKQKEAAEKSKRERQKGLDKKIVTVIEPAAEFYKAEEHHQRYFEKNNIEGGLC